MNPTEAAKKFNALQPFFELLQDSKKLKSSDEYKAYFKLYDIRTMFFIMNQNFNNLKKQLDTNKEKLIIRKNGAARWRNQRETSRLMFNYITSACAYIEKYLSHTLNKRHKKFIYKCLTQELRNYLLHKGELPLSSYYSGNKDDEIIIDEKIKLHEIKELLTKHGKREQKENSKKNFELIEKEFKNEIYATSFFLNLHELLNNEHHKKLIELAHKDREKLLRFESDVSLLLNRFKLMNSENIISNNHFQFPISESQLRGLRWLLKQTDKK